MFSKKWWSKTLERMTKTAAGTLLSCLGVDRMLSDVNWDVTWQLTVGTTLISFLSAIVTTNMGPDRDDPSAV